MQVLIAVILFSISSSYLLFLDYISSGPHVLQKSLAIPVIMLILILFHSAKNLLQLFTNPYDKWLFLFGGTIFIQLLIIATGGFQSPFFILIHLFMIGISFLLSFSVSIIFLLSSFVVIFVDMSFRQDIVALILKNPSTIVLQMISLISITPLAYIVSQQYHAKEIITTLLKKKVATDESIMSNLNEMIIVTDPQFRILSVNDAAARMLQHSRSELLEKPLFDMLLLKDKHGSLVTEKTFFPDVTKPTKSSGEFTLVRSPIPQRNVTLQTQPIIDSENGLSEVSFVIGLTHTSDNPLVITRDRARAKYDVLMQNIKKQLLSEKDNKARTDVLLLEKIEQDTYVLPLIKTYANQHHIVPIDLAQLCKQIVSLNQDFANQFHVATNFVLPNFGKEDIAPLTVANYPVNPEQLTGPFFTVNCDVRQIELAIKKLFDIAIFLASKEVTPHVTVNVQRGDPVTIVVSIIGSCPTLKEEELKDLFVPYYDLLMSKTNLQSGSGLEGFLVKQITDTLLIPLDVQYRANTSEIEFTLKIPKKPFTS